MKCKNSRYLLGTGRGQKALEILPALPCQRLGRTARDPRCEVGGEGAHASRPKRGMMMAARATGRPYRDRSPRLMLGRRHRMPNLARLLLGFKLPERLSNDWRPSVTAGALAWLAP